MIQFSFSANLLRNAFLVTLAAGLMSACSAKVSGSDIPGGGGDNKPQVAADQVPPIDLNGVWTSQCEGEPHGFGTVKVVMTINDHDFTRAVTYYKDYYCQTLDSTDTISGKFSFQKSKPDSVYEVEYLVTSGTAYRMPGNIKRVGDKLWIGLIANADYAPTIPLTLTK